MPDLEFPQEAFKKGRKVCKKLEFLESDFLSREVSLLAGGCTLLTP